MSYHKAAYYQSFRNLQFITGNLLWFIGSQVLKSNIILKPLVLLISLPFIYLASHSSAEFVTLLNVASIISILIATSAQRYGFADYLGSLEINSCYIQICAHQTSHANRLHFDNYSDNINTHAKTDAVKSSEISRQTTPATLSVLTPSSIDDNRGKMGQGLYTKNHINQSSRPVLKCFVRQCSSKS